MAASRRISTCLRQFSRVLTQCESRNVSTVGHKIYFDNRLLLLPHRHCSVAAASKTSQLETLLNSGSVDEVMESANDKTDVYLFGMAYETTKKDIENFFGGLDIEDVCYVDTSKCRLKEFYYVRFKNEESKTKAVAKHKEKIGPRYVEICGLENRDLIGSLILRNRSKTLEVKNLPFSAEKGDLIKWFKPVEVKPQHMVFIRRGTCLVDFQSDSDVAEVFKRRGESLDGRQVFLSPFIPRDALFDFKKKYVRRSD